MVIFQPVPICKGGFPRSISNGKSYCVLGCDPGDGNSGGIDADVTRDAAGQRNIWDLSYQKAQEIISNRQQEVMRNLKTYEEEYAIRYNKLRKFQNRRNENSPQNKGQGQRHLVE